MNVIEELYAYYNGFCGEKKIVGYTENGLPVPCFFVGNGKPSVIIQAGIHAREYITTYLVLEQIKYACKYDKYLLGNVCFVPAVNIDGILMCINGKPLYKSNKNGVDLNVNFPSGFGQGKSNKFSAGHENYVGPHPFSESESRILRDITLDIEPWATVSYHSKGEEIYWYYNQRGKNVVRDRCLAQKISELTGYPTRYAFLSHGGYKDWCIDELGITALTIEVGNDNLIHPIQKEYLWHILKNNLTLPLRICSIISTSGLWNKR